MKFIGKFSEKLRNPTSLFAAVWHSLTIVFAVGVVLCTVFLDALPRWVPSLVNMLSAVFFGVSVYMLAVRLFPLPKKLAAKLGRHKWLGKFFDYSFRTKFFSAISFCLNAGYALFQAVLAVLGRSVGLGALAAYYFVLASARGGLLLWDRKIADSDSPDAEREKKQARAYLFSGILLTLLTAMIVPAIIQHHRRGSKFFSVHGVDGVCLGGVFLCKNRLGDAQFFPREKAGRPHCAGDAQRLLFRGAHVAFRLAGHAEPGVRDRSGIFDAHERRNERNRLPSYPRDGRFHDFYGQAAAAGRGERFGRLVGRYGERAGGKETAAGIKARFPA